jgi:two-component system chemotaxis response regulator CheB
MPKDIVVIGASAGGIEALRVLVGRLPADLPASLFLVVHTSPQAPSMLADGATWPNIWIRPRIINPPRRFSNAPTKQDDEPV